MSTFDPNEPDPALPVDSQLTVDQMFTVVTREGSDPPEMNLHFDVKHADTDHGWRVGLHLSRSQIIELHLLLHSAVVDHNMWEA